MPHNQKLILVMINSSYKISFLKGGSCSKQTFLLGLSKRTPHYLLTFSWRAPALSGVPCFRCVAFLF